MSKRCKLDVTKELSTSSECARSPKTYDGSDSSSGNLCGDNLPNESDFGKNVTTSKDVGANDFEFTRLPTPVKAPTDKKEYSAIKLKNGLRALLVSDIPNLIRLEDLTSPIDSENEIDSGSSSGEESIESFENNVSNKSQCSAEEKMSACALCVGVGSFSDPENIPGLAHFLEHMVFMGSEKYPKENEFDAFIKTKGGSDNASTECEHTTFYFECNDQHLLRGMDMFAQFFISPLMKREAMTREREAIESEFQMSLPNDTYRREQLLGSMGNSNNPVRKFMWGNHVTLRDNVTDDVLYSSVHEFWQRHYSAHRMTVAIQSRLPIKELEKWVLECFSMIPCNNLPPVVHKISNEAFIQEKFCKIYYVEPIKDICELEISWALPPLRGLYKSKPGDYLSWLIGHEGKGSLISYLRNKLWALDITTSHGDDGLTSNNYFSIFNICINLTEDGYSNINKVLETVFSYIKMVKKEGPQKRLYGEIKRIEDINFQFAEEDVPVEYVESLSEAMQFYPIEDLITGPNIFFEYKPQEITKLINYFHPSFCNIMISSKKVPQQFELDQEEEWFKTKYTSEEISKDFLLQLENVEPYPEFHLPEPNLFIPDDFTLLPTPENIFKYPQKIKETNLIEVFYKQDTKFKLPQAMIYCNIITEVAHKSAKNEALQSVFVLSLKHLLTEKIYPATMAQLEYSLSSTDKGLGIVFSGFNQKLELLVEAITNQIVSFSNDIYNEIFEEMKKVMLRQYLNACLTPEFLSRDVRMKLITKEMWTAVEKFNYLQESTLEDLKEFCKTAYKKVFLQCLVQGNMSYEQTLFICDKISSTLNCSPHNPETIPEMRVRQIEEGETICRVKAFNPNDSNCVTSCYFQMGPGKIKDYCLLDVLLMLMGERLFDTLRTQEQLGYEVSCTLRDTFGILGFSVTVVSQVAKHTVDHVESRITNFLENFSDILVSLSSEEFEEVISSLIKLKKCGDVHLKEEVCRNWEEIKSCEYVFERLEKEVDILSHISQEDVSLFFKSQIGLDGKNNKRKLVVQVVAYEKQKNCSSQENEILSSERGNLNFELITSSTENTKLHFVQNLYTHSQNFVIYPINRKT